MVETEIWNGVDMIRRYLLMSGYKLLLSELIHAGF